MGHPGSRHPHARSECPVTSRRNDRVRQVEADTVCAQPRGVAVARAFSADDCPRILFRPHQPANEPEPRTNPQRRNQVSARTSANLAVGGPVGQRARGAGICQARSAGRASHVSAVLRQPRSGIRPGCRREPPGTALPDYGNETGAGLRPTILATAVRARSRQRFVGVARSLRSPVGVGDSTFPSERRRCPPCRRFSSAPRRAGPSAFDRRRTRITVPTRRRPDGSDGRSPV